MAFDSLNHSCLFLWPNAQDFFAKSVAAHHVDVGQLYLLPSRYMRIVEKIGGSLQQLIEKSLLGSWQRKIGNYQTIIVYATSISAPVVKKIRQLNARVRIIVWYWNPVAKSVPVEAFKDLNCELWSFDRADCERYKINFHTTFYFSSVHPAQERIEQDVFFVGRDKGRIQELILIQNTLKDLGLKAHFHIVPPNKIEPQFKKYYSRRFMPYPEVLQNINRSRAILDFVSPNQSGYTLRPLEALFLNKKLITNEPSIRQETFYRSENIFIYGEDDQDKLLDFINSPFQKVDPSAYQIYDFDNWLSAILKSDNIKHE